MDISKIDKNLTVEAIGDVELEFRPYGAYPFRLHGAIVENGVITRLPREVGLATSQRVAGCATLLAGARIRFRTNSSRVAIKYTVPWRNLMPHMAPSGSYGFDLYADDFDGRGEYFRGTFVPSFAKELEFEGMVKLWNHKMRDVTLNLPLYNGLSSLVIGLDPGAELLPAADYRNPTPVVYYGSSITQGGCASRPGNCYEALLSRRLGTDFLCLGFSGSAQGEDAIREYISGLDMSAFVLDYDHNAPTLEHLAATHYKMYEAVRAAHPNIYIIMLSRPKFYISSLEAQRRDLIRETYERALAAGDTRVRFIDGNTIFPPDVRDDATVDGCHPTDLGFYFMAGAIEPHLREALEIYESEK